MGGKICIFVMVHKVYLRKISFSNKIKNLFQIKTFFTIILTKKTVEIIHVLNFICEEVFFNGKHYKEKKVLTCIPSSLHVNPHY